MLNKEQKTNFENNILCHEQYLFRMARSLIRNKESAQDLVQQTFIKAYEKWNKFEHRKGSSCKTWISKILMNEFLNMYKLNKNRLDISLNLHELDEYLTYKRPLMLDNNLRPDQILAAKTVHNEMKEAIEELENPYKTVMILYVLEDRSYEEVAKMLEISVNTVKSRIHRARKKLQETLQEYSNDK